MRVFVAGATSVLGRTLVTEESNGTPESQDIDREETACD
jgi:hypothetical protein